jgi:hypothetical protein
MRAFAAQGIAKRPRVEEAGQGRELRGAGAIDQAVIEQELQKAQHLLVGAAVEPRDLLGR